MKSGKTLPRRVLAAIIAFCLTLTLIPAVTFPARAAETSPGIPEILTDGGVDRVFAKGTPVVILDNGGTIELWSDTGNGTPGTVMLPDIAGLMIYGGWPTEDYEGDTSVTVISGTITNTIYGGSRNGDITGNTNVTIKDSTVTYVYGGGANGAVTGTATVKISDASVAAGAAIYGAGNANTSTTGNTDITLKNVEFLGALVNTYNWVYGGGYAGAVTGSTKINIDLGAGNKLNMLCGGGNAASATVGGNTDITVTSGEVIEVYGGGWAGNVTGDTNINITGGTLNSHIYGGGGYSNVGGTANVTVGSGVTCNGLYNIYGGSGAVGTVGNTKVTVSGGAWSHIFGGSGGWDNSGNPAASAVTGNAEVIIEGNATVGSVYGSANGNVNGTSKITIRGNAAVEAYIYGGADGGTSTVGNVELTIGGNATVGSGGFVCGGGSGTDVTGNVVINIQDNAMIKTDVYGGGNNADIGGSVTINFWGGRLTNGLNQLYIVYSGGKGTGNVAAETINVSSNVAQWVNYGDLHGTVVNNFSLDYTANGGTGTAPAQVYKAQGETFAAASNMFTAPNGKQFKEWNTAASGGAATAYAAGATVIMPNSDLTLYAIWEDLPAYTVTFNSNGGSAVASITGIAGSTITAPTAPTKTGYTFGG